MSVFEPNDIEPKSGDAVALASDAQGDDASKVANTELSLTELMAKAGEAVVFLDHEWRARYCNETFARLLASSVADIIGRTPQEFFPDFERSDIVEVVRACMNERKPSIHVGYSTLSNIWYLARLYPVMGGVMIAANEATARVVQKYLLIQDDTHDRLTSLPNKLALTSDMDYKLKRGEPFELILVGVDRFKIINDELGFSGGDMALLTLSARLKSALAVGDQIYRVGGDEFAVVAASHAHDAWATAEKLLQALRVPLVVGGQSFNVQGSAGGVVSGTTGVDADKLLKCASLALRRAKHSHRGEFYPFHHALEREAHRRVTLEAELRVAMAEGAMQVVLQPIGSLITGEILGAEALLRWQHPDRGQILPEEFFGVARSSGLMRHLDKWCFRRAIEALRVLNNAGLNIPLSVNLSPESAAHPKTAGRVARSLEVHGISPDQIEVDLNEMALARDLEESTLTIVALHQLGVRVNIDDFGTGSAAFFSLLQLPISSLKIARQLLVDLQKDSASEKIMRGIVRMAHSMNVSVVGKGVEHDRQVGPLKLMQCDAIQGWAYAKPMEVDAFVRFAKSRSRELRDLRDGTASTMSMSLI